MPAQQQNPDGSWSPATPLPYQPGYDAEIGVGWDSQGRRRHTWTLFHATPADALIGSWREVAFGTSRTHLGAAVRLVLAKWWDQVRSR